MDEQNIARFWDNFIEKLKPYSVKHDVVRWHVRHAEDYIKAHTDDRLADHSPQFVEKYLQEKGRQKWLKNWQFQQVVMAIKILFVDVVKICPVNIQHPPTHCPLPSNAMVLPLSGT